MAAASVFAATDFGALVSAADAIQHADKISFNRDIRPLLADTCLNCHGADEKQRKAGLRLDVREMATKPAESGETVIVPGKPDASELVRRITSDDPDARMPPVDSQKQLTSEQIERLRRWIVEGAEYEGHWAFQSPQRPAVPTLDQEKTWPRNPIDAFVLQRQLRAGLTPSPEADRTTLIRRLSLDLTGLPPTPAEVDAFLADNSPEAYEKVVDRLLASKHYGEQMALPWLDFARYADSNGYQTDGSRFQWPWRDWVIEAFNANMPFDQFTVEQLAGDLLPNATPEQIVATGFQRNHRLNGEGGIIAEEWRVETVIDRVETTGLTWLGLTLGCCRCHDHKYDPISQREFYQFYAFFNNITESGTLQGDGKNTDPVMPVVTAAHRAEVARLQAAIVAAEAQAAEAAKQMPEKMAAWEAEFRKQLATSATAWVGLSPNAVNSLGGATFTKQDDGTYLASGTNPPHDTYEIVAPLAAGSFTGLLLECFPDDRLPNKSLGRYPNGNFVLTRIEAELTAPSLPAPIKVPLTKAEADFSQDGWNIKSVNDGNPANGWAVDGPTRREPRKAMFLAETGVNVPAEATLTVRLFHEAINQHNIGRFRLSATSLPPGTVTLEGQQVSALVREAIAIDAAEKRSPEQQAALVALFRQSAASPLKQADDAIAALKKSLADLEKNLPNVMVMKEGPPRDAFFLIRGEYDRRGDKVFPALPAALVARQDEAPADADVRPRSGRTTAADAAKNRLDLAAWIVDKQNPLTARVWVNRAWEKFFGTGLVKTSENLGTQAEYPSHPELLDWLACEFMEPTVSPAVGGVAAKPWDMKALQKLIVMSATYRQSSHVPAARRQSLAIDPENRLLSRGPRFRLSGELIRDEALAAAGLLVPTIGGPSVRPYMPDGVWDETSRYGDLRNYMADKGEGLYRRTMYTIWKRSAAPPTMLLFDAPNREVCTVKRSRTNTPLQALSLLNEITFVEAARKLGERMIFEGGATTDERLRFGFRVALARQPSDGELSVLRTGFESDLASFRAAPSAAAKLLSFGTTKPRDGLDPAESAAYALTANVILNLDEFVTRE